MATFDEHGRPRDPDFVREFLDEAAAAGLKRSLRRLIPVSAREVETGDGRCLNFSSNDYLGLSFHPYLREEAVRWLEKYGAGAGASRLVTGTVDAMLDLEERIAAWKGAEAALVLGSGYMANVGLLAALAGRQTVLFADKLNHASLNSGCQLSGADFVRYRHNDMVHLEEMIARHADAKVKIIVSDTVFSMDGDLAHPEQLRDIARRHDCLLYLDDAHATGVFGDRGEGLACGGAAHVSMSTFSKAMGSYGACVTCSAAMKDYLINRCGPFIFSTALPPAVYGSIAAAVKLMDSDEIREARTGLWRRVERLRRELQAAGFDTGDSTTQIIPVIVGDAQRALDFSRRLLEKNILAVAIRPPTVPKGSARLRLSLNAAHTDADVDYLLESLRQIAGNDISS